MQFNTLIFLNTFILYNIYKLVVGKPIVGQNVQNAGQNEYSFVVALAELDPNCTIEENLFCSGSLLTKSHVLTADHCLVDVEYYPFRVYTGSNNITCTTPYVPLSWINFDQWSTQQNKTIEFPENDITIIKLTLNVPDRIPIATLSPIELAEDLYGEVAIIVGWGELTNNVVPQLLKKANVNIITNGQCRYMISRLKGEIIFVPEEQYLCSQNDPYLHMGAGDSGGPLIYENQLIAVSKALSPDIDFDPEQINSFLFIDIYRPYIAANIVI